MIRAFVGLELPSIIREDLETLCSGLKDVRWVASYNMHITLAFIGDVDESQLIDLDTELAAIRFDPFDLSLAEVDCFETRGKPKVIWAGVKGAVEELTHLHHKVMNAVEHAGLEPERRKYKPHVTLARLRSPPKERVLDYMEGHNGFKTDAFQLTQFTLFRSHLTRHGADYEVLKRYG